MRPYMMLLKCSFFALMTLLWIGWGAVGYATNGDTKVSVTTLPESLDTGVKLLQFVVTAQSGSLKSLDGSRYQLVLNGVNEKTTFVTNEPRRIVGWMTTGYFLKRWIKPAPNDYATTPSNGTLIYNLSSVKQSQVLYVQALSPPLYDEATHQLTFNVQPVQDPLMAVDSMDTPVLVFSSPAVCGLLGAWGNLPGETQYNQGCHTSKEGQSEGGSAPLATTPSTTTSSGG